ncbi:hypothetical protein L9F63_015139, partial [Diploptera punctata]
NTAHPVNGIFHSQESSLAMDRVEISSYGSDIHEEEENNCLHRGIEVGAECMENRRRGSASIPAQRPSLASLNVSGSGHRPSMTLIVPPTSYSSSEEEDFYDANEFNDTPSSSTSPTIGMQPYPDPPSTEDSPEIPVRDDGTLDYDALYEENAELDCDIEVHGSVVSHLISQVKIGMDLTKVVLPTFILERRSLLEMYADYFAHPDIFIKISEFKDPKERMVQVVRWYLSAYHAGRKSTVAKKPYNPIIGEIFQCYWDIPGNTETSSSLVTDGPVPWCSRNQLTFIAEQVSHHPPISAFYAEHYNNRISFCAHVWTKSKFLGLSIGVHNIGQGCVSVLDYDEEYIVTFPNGYGRSILTVPWIELGGPPNEKKPFLSIAGEWNGTMDAKWSDGRTETFVDVNKIDIVKKKVRLIAEQSENESRRLWKEVTAGLRLKDIDRATNAKYELEQRQRDEAKDRKERGLKWETQWLQQLQELKSYKSKFVSCLSVFHEIPIHHSLQKFFE